MVDVDAAFIRQWVERLRADEPRALAVVLKGSYARGDDLALRLAAQGLGGLCPSVLRPLNPPVSAGSRTEALRLVLDFPVAPPTYREDLLLCLGLTGRAAAPEAVAAAAARLVDGVVSLARQHARRLAPELPPHLPRYLADGTLERYLGVDGPAGRSGGRR